MLQPMLRFPLLPSQLYSFILVANFAFPSPLPQQTFPIRKPVKINQKRAQKDLEKFCLTTENYLIYFMRKVLFYTSLGFVMKRKKAVPVN